MRVYFNDTVSSGIVAFTILEKKKKKKKGLVFVSLMKTDVTKYAPVHIDLTTCFL